jgi:hypothetical protein
MFLSTQLNILFSALELPRASVSSASVQSSSGFKLKLPSSSEIVGCVHHPWICYPWFVIHGFVIHGFEKANHPCFPIVIV